MSEEILINVTPSETRVAVVENGVLQEVHIERTSKRGLVGNIYKGKVGRVLPGMQAAFIDIGLERAAFLHASDITSTVVHNEVDNAKKHESISELLSEGSDVIVQVVKDPLGTKGARLTTHIAIPSRYLVLLPGESNVGVSSRIEDEDERNRLRETVAGFVNQEQDAVSNGYIVRTVAEGADSNALRADQIFLCKLWTSIQEKINTFEPETIIYEDLMLAVRSLRDFVHDEIEKVRVDSRESYQKLMEFSDKFVPHMSARLEYYPGERPIFDLYGIEDEIQKALESKVQLKSGGYLIIDQTEAMTTIDVNTGAYVGHRNQEETIFKTNLEAAQAIARQLRLRNLGGIIIIDFIDMMLEEHKQSVIKALERYLAKDHAKSHITEVSSLGLVEMTRKRTRESLGHILCEPCQTCGGCGSVKTAETVCYEIFREIMREARQYDAVKLLVLASQEAVDYMLDEESTSVAELEDFIGVPIKFQVEALYTQEQFDVVLM
ncbi:MAG: ribonuclease G [Gammaproteobacteria bacterium]|nr:ribonuclease G [Gammaproteobacteria bacterium]MCK5091329.1 ribonuclease G [Gammaproteobacteria bacterium]